MYISDILQTSGALIGLTMLLCLSRYLKQALKCYCRTGAFR